ncbi:endoglucanase [Streptomyces agglomeratus]|uniref:Glucanase n=2 Tax=Streptomyces agglomeratus TaxID=285458 RepID=A0A1E5PJQ6_9ACTN|nr:glycoside hydrolase family 6 protein [Streptomyces agglomeratus]OEJ29767.1 endoglucanase [Streptomyces agglomeratus]OEJ38059.1 endoglucanase [Streptomyces agglomeratus]OEJ47558.1 endoglucanase [Streptomyces agglomeratus]OEJ50586.1 endoglucanase [Streptomyces agglomeratus]OEJ62908.1 endoglucanase [Streptomyces agglomeratus]
MAAAASVVVAVGAVTGVVSAVTADVDHRNTARPETGETPVQGPLPARPTASRTPSAQTSAPRPASPSPSPPPASPSSRARESRDSPASPSAARPTRQSSGPSRAAPVGDGLYRHPESQVLDWVRANRDDPRHPLIKSRIADRPAAVWFAAYDPGAVTARVRSVTSAAERAGRVPVLVPYAIPGRDCGGASQGGAPDLGSYDRWIGAFAAGLGGGEVIVVLEPDSIALSDCLSAGERRARFASLARAGRTLHAANPRAKVYFDAGHSGWHSAEKQAAALRAAGARSHSDGVFTNVSNFHHTADEAAYARRVLAALGGPPGLGAVIDTSRNGNGPPAGGQWCDPAGRALGRAPTTRTGEAKVDAYLWVKLPGESDGCKGAAGTFTPDYAYQLARGT